MTDPNKNKKEIMSGKVMTLQEKLNAAELRTSRFAKGEDVIFPQEVRREIKLKIPALVYNPETREYWTECAYCGKPLRASFLAIGRGGHRTARYCPGC